MNKFQALQVMIQKIYSKMCPLLCAIKPAGNYMFKGKNRNTKAIVPLSYC